MPRPKPGMSGLGIEWVPKFTVARVVQGPPRFEVSDLTLDAGDYRNNSSMTVSVPNNSKMKLLQVLFLLLIVLTVWTQAITSHIVCEHQSQVLSCPNDLTVNIIHADFGRTEGAHICPGPVRTTDCSTGGSALSTIQATCWDKTPVLSQHRTTYSAILVGGHLSISTSHIRVLSGTVIRIDHAVYGRTEGGEVWPGPVYNTSCSAGPSVLTLVKDDCDNRISCEISAINDNYGDPCSGTNKYLNVTYSCIDCETAFGRGWKSLGVDVSQSCFLFLGKPKTNTKAQERCEARRGHLVKIESAAENYMILGNINQGKKNVWLGMKWDRLVNVWKWIDNPTEQVMWTNFDPALLDDHNGNEDCASMSKEDGKWNDVPCDKTLNVVCEIEVCK
ncbi:hypothetical protein ScPMuIL_015257 [Solemya velum]